MLPASVNFFPIITRLKPAFLITLIAFAAFCTLSLPASANSKYSGIVIDANSGKVLYSSHADSLRYPASLTKMMTLYLVFEALDSGKIKTSSRIPVSAHAASQPPSKIGFRPGQTVSVESAIYLLVTKSANDVAAAVGEYLGGSESGFAKMMTQKARQLGMRRTTFRNASGLPNSGQKTTARDMALLGLALREHFPHHYRVFATRSYKYGKRRYGNHNRLLGKVKGVDGIKTGYIRAAGFNLVSSVSVGKRRIVAVVMGGKTGRSRDRHMADLIGRYLPRATRRKGGPLVAARSPSRRLVASLPARSVPKPAPRPEPEVRTASATTLSFARKPEPRPEPEVVDPVTTSSNPVDGWVIQVGSMPSEDAAMQMLQRTKRQAGQALASAAPFTQTFEKDGMVYYRARYGGFDSKSDAWKTCGVLKRKKIACYAVRQ